ncbi:hypothetical protein PIB30_075551 [Stylosanthes scabra]|uniref:Uncharacterized protein n=1 Tax=Stylosanthes scabra TaxID=79078 RepID=A0ABU6UR40_9FABA|nr:hypothetical protein [Stylosanthes scabra]
MLAATLNTARLHIGSRRLQLRGHDESKPTSFSYYTLTEPTLIARTNKSYLGSGNDSESGSRLRRGLIDNYDWVSPVMTAAPFLSEHNSSDPVSTCSGDYDRNSVTAATFTDDETHLEPTCK